MAGGAFLADWLVAVVIPAPAGKEGVMAWVISSVAGVAGGLA